MSLFRIGGLRSAGRSWAEAALECACGCRGGGGRWRGGWRAGKREAWRGIREDRSRLSGLLDEKSAPAISAAAEIALGCARGGDGRRWRGGGWGGQWWESTVEEEDSCPSVSDRLGGNIPMEISHAHLMSDPVLDKDALRRERIGAVSSESGSLPEKVRANGRRWLLCDNDDFHDAIISRRGYGGQVVECALPQGRGMLDSRLASLMFPKGTTGSDISAAMRPGRGRAGIAAATWPSVYEEGPLGFCKQKQGTQKKNGHGAGFSGRRSGTGRRTTMAMSQRPWQSSSPSPSSSLAREIATQAHRRARGIHLFQCPDRLGIVARLAECVASNGANMVTVDLHIDFDASDAPVFYSRSEFSFDPLQWPREVMEAEFEEIARELHATKSVLRVFGTTMHGSPKGDPPMRMAILASWQDHCLVDVLHRWQEGEVRAVIKAVISNHERQENTSVMRFLQRHNIPYYYLPTTKADKKEDEILDIVAETTDFLALARYMQVLSPEFLKKYGKDIINIHHGLLPSFKGANPYKQAYKAGVKLIGATSHFVTEELDDGPIIEQMVARVSHRDSLPSFARTSKILERQCFTNAIKYYCDYRIMKYSGNKTIVFT